MEGRRAPGSAWMAPQHKLHQQSRPCQCPAAQLLELLPTRVQVPDVIQVTFAVSRFSSAANPAKDAQDSDQHGAGQRALISVFLSLFLAPLGGCLLYGGCLKEGGTVWVQGCLWYVICLLIQHYFPGPNERNAQQQLEQEQQQKNGFQIPKFRSHQTYPGGWATPPQSPFRFGFPFSLLIKFPFSSRAANPVRVSSFARSLACVFCSLITHLSNNVMAMARDRRR